MPAAALYSREAAKNADTAELSKSQRLTDLRWLGNRLYSEARHPQKRQSSLRKDHRMSSVISACLTTPAHCDPTGRACDGQPGAGVGFGHPQLRGQERAAACGWGGWRFAESAVRCEGSTRTPMK